MGLTPAPTPLEAAAIAAAAWPGADAAPPATHRSPLSPYLADIPEHITASTPIPAAVAAAVAAERGGSLPFTTAAAVVFAAAPGHWEATARAAWLPLEPLGVLPLHGALAPCAAAVDPATGVPLTIGALRGRAAACGVVDAATWTWLGSFGANGKVESGAPPPTTHRLMPAPSPDVAAHMACIMAHTAAVLAPPLASVLGPAATPAAGTAAAGGTTAGTTSTAAPAPPYQSITDQLLDGTIPLPPLTSTAVAMAAAAAAASGSGGGATAPPPITVRGSPVAATAGTAAAVLEVAYVVALLHTAIVYTQTNTPHARARVVNLALAELLACLPLLRQPAARAKLVSKLLGIDAVAATALCDAVGRLPLSAVLNMAPACRAAADVDAAAALASIAAASCTTAPNGAEVPLPRDPLRLPVARPPPSAAAPAPPAVSGVHGSAAGGAAGVAASGAGGGEPAGPRARVVRRVCRVVGRRWRRRG